VTGAASSTIIVVVRVSVFTDARNDQAGDVIHDSHSFHFHDTRLESLGHLNPCAFHLSPLDSSSHTPLMVFSSIVIYTRIRCSMLVFCFV
jgi:hypothetical protein